MYHVNRYEILMASVDGDPTVTFATTGQKLFWSPQCVPHLVRIVAVNLHATPATGPVLRFDKRVTYSSDTGIVTGVATLNVTTSHTYTAGTQARIVYKYLDPPILVQPGEELVVNVTTADANVTAARVSLWVEAVYETPANVTAGSGPLPSMSLSA